MSAIQVYCEELDDHPHCIHGPTLLFSRQVKGKERKFYGCSAYRCRKDCSFFMWKDVKVEPTKLSVWKERQVQAVSNINHKQIYNSLCKFKSLPLKLRKFCLTCFTFVFPSDLSHSAHVNSENISNNLLTYPSLFIKPIESSKKEAQFWFKDNSKKFVIDSMKSIGASKCLCIGTPTVHELLRETEIKSLLLDIDKRYHYFYSEEEFCWFNMFNCYFLNNSDKCKEVLKEFLNNSSVGVIIDPPFGARIEPLANTINLLQKQASSKLNIFLILPYFMEANVIKCFPNFVMLDYQIQYSNHSKFQNKLSKKKASPVRIFTNILPSLLKMPESEGYYFCKDCKCWRSEGNKHCGFCATCPSKNGHPYVHCNKCAKCVKQTWIHCNKCSRCCIPNHKCDVLHTELELTNKSRKRVKQSDDGLEVPISRNVAKKKNCY